MFADLKSHAAKAPAIEELFADPNRARDFSARAGDLLLDYSKTSLTAESRAALFDLFDQRGVAARRTAMFAGQPINDTESRAVLHSALRHMDQSPVLQNGQDVMPLVRETRARMADFARALRLGDFTVAGNRVDDVINIGIGGSDLGPAMAVRALAPYADGPRCHFVSNVDPADIADALAACDPKRSLVIVASKTFTTIETMTNAQTARDWLVAAGCRPEDHLAALSSATDRTTEWGIPADRVFGFEDWVGGRYSVWGPIGLSLMLAIGPDHFESFLQGAADMDAHFCDAPWDQNLPAILAIVGLWHNQVCGYPTRAVLPYDNRLGRFPAYLQQLEMESNGKRVTLEGDPIPVSGPVVWGEPGTNGQHAFYQLIHQGTQIVPCEFLIAARGHSPDLHHQHRLLAANCLAQSEALMQGRSLDEARARIATRFEGPELERQAAHRVFPGNRPSVTLAYPQLTPHMLGMLIALYEHRVFVEGAVLGLNSYDQWGVELGKELATALQPIVEGAPADSKDGSTQVLVTFLRGAGL